MTKKYKRLYVLFSILSVIATIGPLLYYIIAGLCSDAIVVRKVGLTCTILLALIFTVLNVLFKYSIRSTVWILLLGVYLCLDSIIALLIMLAIGTILDEFLLSPMKKKYKEKYTINKEIDKRGV